MGRLRFSDVLWVVATAVVAFIATLWLYVAVASVRDDIRPVGDRCVVRRFDSAPIEGREAIEWGVVPHRRCIVETERGTRSLLGDDMDALTNAVNGALVGTGAAMVVGWLMAGRLRRRRRRLRLSPRSPQPPDASAAPDDPTVGGAAPPEG